MVTVGEKYNHTLNLLINQELRSGKAFHFIVSSFSMFPLLKPRDEIVVRKSPLKALSCGDIVVFERDKTLYAHRLLGKKKTGVKIKLIIKGDNSKAVDSPITEGQLLGKVVKVKRGNKLFNLESRPWQTVNSLAGILSYLEWTIYNVLRSFKRALLSHSSAQSFP